MSKSMHLRVLAMECICTCRAKGAKGDPLLRAYNEKKRGTRISGRIAKAAGSAFNRIFGSEKEKERKKTRTRESEGKEEESRKRESQGRVQGRYGHRSGTKESLRCQDLDGPSRNEFPRRM
jgi:hypothetical protein